MEVLDKGFIELIDHMGNDQTVVAAARVSYLSESKGPEQDAKLIHYMMEHGHTSPFEHVMFTFRIKCPLFVRGQWHRHRTWKYNEISRRYTSEEIELYMPTKWRLQATDNKQSSLEETLPIDARLENEYLGESGLPFQDCFIHHCETAIFLYESMLDIGIAREMARMVLPQNMYTTFYGTVDLHNLLHFLKLRLDPHAQYEIRVYAEAILKLIEPIVPISIQSWKEKYKI